MTLVAHYPTKKALKEAKGQRLRYSETSLHGEEYKADGVLTIVGPEAYVRKFYANVTMANGLIKKVS